MKRLLLILAIALLPSFAGRAQDVEKIYVCSDRDVYVAGDEIWCSLFSLDASSGKLSAFSAVSYVELVSEDGTVAQAKISLMEGRGAGKFRIPVSAPTGNYRLLAYTARYPEAYLPGSKLVSVYNTTSTARVTGGVNVIPDEDYSVKTSSPSSDGLLNVSLKDKPRCGQPFTLGVSVPGEAVDVAVSVYELDGLNAPSGRGWSDFFEGLKSPVRASGKLPEYEGEIVYAAVEGLAGRQLDSLSQVAVATLSSAGSPTDVYVGKVGDGGRLIFFTNNIYGDRELVCEVSGGSGYISLMDPFQYPEVDNIPPLELSSAQRDALLRRKAGVGVSLQLDTLVQFLPRRQDVLLENAPKHSYHLDNYTRFPSFREVIVEIVSELRIRTIRGKHQLQLIVTEDVSGRKIAKDNLLVMMDGVVISDLRLLEEMDAMLLEDVDIYPENIALGGLSYGGLVNFVTKKSYVKAMQFPSNVRVVDFKGVCYPVAYLGAPVSGKDRRPILFWHPALKVVSGEDRLLHLVAPERPGTYRIVAEGLTASGKPLLDVYDFEISL